MATEPVLTSTSRIWMDDDGLVHVELLPGSDETLAAAQENAAAVAALVGHAQRFLFIDVRRMRSIERAARRYYAEEQGVNMRLRAIALLVSSPVSRVIGNFVVSAFSQNPAEIRLFTGEDEALAWLKGLAR